MPESMYYKDGKLYVSLCKQDHSTFWDEKNQSGAFAIVDCASFTVSALHDIAIDPYDIVVSKDNNIYISAGNVQNQNIYAYTQDGTVIDYRGISAESTIKYNESLNRIYTISSYVSPRNMSAYSLCVDGKFAKDGSNYGYSWPYNGDFGSYTNFEVAPDGKYIFNGYGYVLNCANDQKLDMIKSKDINAGFNDISFDLNQKYFLYCCNKQLCD